MAPPPATTSTDSTGALASTRLDEKWFVNEVHALDGSLKSYLRVKYPSVRDVDDVVQESYLRIWKVRATCSFQSVKAFLFQVARNLALDVIRRESRSPIDAVVDLGVVGALDETPTAAEAACTEEELAILTRAIESLPPRCREVFILRRLHGLSCREIAERLGISENTLQRHLTRGMEGCEQYLSKHGL